MGWYKMLMHGIYHGSSMKILLIEILKRTPPWVFVLFFVLLALGYSQSKERAVKRGSVSVLPIVMITLSFYSVFSAFGIAPVGFIFWLFGSGAAVLLGLVLTVPRSVRYSTETQLYLVPGSWLPLVLMMTIFFIRYYVGYVFARQLPIAVEPVFIGSISFCYGIFSGLFFARALVIWRSEKAR
jgi:hypothetical protein